MKKLILSVFALLVLACFVGCSPEKTETKFSFKEVELIGTVQEIVVVNADANLQYWTVKVDNQELPQHLFTDEKGKVGDRIIIHIAVRVGGQMTWVKVRPLE